MELSGMCIWGVVDMETHSFEHGFAWEWLLIVGDSRYCKWGCVRSSMFMKSVVLVTCRLAKYIESRGGYFSIVLLAHELSWVCLLCSKHMIKACV